MAHDDRTPRDPAKPRGRRAAPREVHVCIHADGTEHDLRAGEGCDEWVARHVIAGPATDALCADVVLTELGRDLDDLRAGQDAMLADHDAIVNNLRRRIAEQRGAIERATVVAGALRYAAIPPLGGALTIGERTAFEEGWDNAMRVASEFVLSALRAKP